MKFESAPETSALPVIGPEIYGPALILMLLAGAVWLFRRRRMVAGGGVSYPCVGKTVRSDHSRFKSWRRGVRTLKAFTATGSEPAQCKRAFGGRM